MIIIHYLCTQKEYTMDVNRLKIVLVEQKQTSNGWQSS